MALTTAVPQSQPLVDMFRLALNYNGELLSLGLSVVIEMELRIWCVGDCNSRNEEVVLLPSREEQSS